ncbi:MAG TPA: alpha/beta fold hydrolase [Bryobacteraceae bacterium]|nr:alpha/beta fold hydrolase [Bryobacteraceae bacterium]HPT25713.1 alpha/beta fold hydrolase [Bryobacteraceae bacterium]
MAARQIESLFVDGPAGRLEALLEPPAGREPAFLALVCHPHPLGGGTMQNKVVHRMARALRARGAAVLRFNFRGVHLSQGTHDEGRGETEDARAALAFLRARYPDLPFTLAGFSFGSRVTVRLAASLEGAAPARLILAGYPTVYKSHDLLYPMRIPRIFIHSTNDIYGPKLDLQALYDRLWHPKQLHWIEARDHFFEGGLDEFERAVAQC